MPSPPAIASERLIARSVLAESAITDATGRSGAAIHGDSWVGASMASIICAFGVGYPGFGTV